MMQVVVSVIFLTIYSFLLALVSAFPAIAETPPQQSLSIFLWLGYLIFSLSGPSHTHTPVSFCECPDRYHVDSSENEKMMVEGKAEGKIKKHSMCG